MTSEKKKRPSERDIRFEKEANALLKNLEKRKKQQQEREKLKQEKENDNG